MIFESFVEHRYKGARSELYVHRPKTFPSVEELTEMKNWCIDKWGKERRCRWYYDGSFRFTRENDAVLFKLRFG